MLILFNSKKFFLFVNQFNKLILYRKNLIYLISETTFWVNVKRKALIIAITSIIC